mmetsp:Transcript_8149/g.14195  ORF Transcript_8149/g.14195 Transcript_8149/m.14195 type:complete len:124 (-) Transcript_8149:116-487(-)
MSPCSFNDSMSCLKKRGLPLVLWWRTDANGRVMRGLRCNESDTRLFTLSGLMSFNSITSRENIEIELSQALNGPLLLTSSSRYEKVKKTDEQPAVSDNRAEIKSSDAESAHCTSSTKIDMGLE